MISTMSDASQEPSSSEPASWIRGFIQGKTRIVLAWAFALLVGYFAREYPVWPGILVCFIGATLRFWASGYLRKDSRPAVGGPYAHTRNPLYLGTWLMAIGVAWAIQTYLLMLAVSILYAALYHYIILDEETKLRRIFGEPYLKYIAAVPRFFFRPWPAPRATRLEINPDPAHLRYDWQLSMKNKAYEAYASFAGLIGFVTLAAWIWKDLK